MTMPMMDGWLWAPAGLLWLLAVVLVVTVLIVGLVWLLRATTGGASQGPAPQRHSDAARDILDARYARGEISRGDYLQARRDIGDPAD